MIKAIVAVDKKWGIGKNNDLLFHLKEDMAFFRATTLNKIVVMGSNTLASFPGGKPLPKRENIVLFPGGATRDDCTIVQSLDELKSVLNQKGEQDIFVIGGAMFYRTMLPYCSEVLVTKVDADGEAQVFFENLDELDDWKCVYTSDTIADQGYDITFNTYVNGAVKPFI